MYNTNLSTNSRNLVEQYQSAKWGIALTPPGTGATEVAKATASDGYSVFTTRYLERLSSSADISLSATNNINLDFKGDTLNFATSGRALTLTAGNQITTASTGTITTNNGAISLNATSGIVFSNAFTLNSTGGAISLNNATTLNAALTANAGSGTMTFGSTVDGANNLTATAGTFSFASALGGTTPLSAVSLTSTNSLTLPAITASSISATTTGGAADLTIGGALSASASGAAVSLTSGHDVLNSANGENISATNGAGNVSLKAANSILYTSGTGSTITTQGGSITLNADSDASSAGAINFGTGSNLTSNGGAITLGGGATPASVAAYGTASNTSGITLNAATVNASGGNITMTGTGYTGSASYNVGIYFYNAGANAVRTSGTGTINLTGTGGGGTGGNHYGVYAYQSAITSSGTGPITIAGTGAGTGGASDGVFLNGWAGATNSTGGNFIVTGTGSSAGGSSNSGVHLNGEYINTSGTGNVSVTGIQGTGASSYGLILDNSYNSINTNGSGNITINTDSMSLANQGGNYFTSGGNVTVTPYSTGTTIGIAGGAGSLAVPVALISVAGTITIGSTSGTGNIDVGAETLGANTLIQSSSGNITFDGIQTLGTKTLTAATTSGNITLAQNAKIVSTANSGNSIVLTAGGNFFNNDSNDGSGALAAGSGTARYLVYSSDPSLNTMNGLSDAGKHIFNKTYAGYAPGSVTQTGNLFLYSLAPTITVTADNQSRLYGAGDPTFTYSLSGLVDGDTSSILTGSPSFSTPGGDTATSAAGSTYTITTALNTLANAIGYGLTTANGTLTVNKAHLTVTADPKSMTYGAGSLPGLTDTITGFMNGENSGVVSGSASLSTAATAYNGTAGTGSNAGSYTITAAANNLAAANYDFAYANGTLTVNKAVLTATADNQSRLYGAANPTFTETVTGYANGDTSGVLTGSATGSSAATTTTGIGGYTITGSTGTLGASNNNYTFATANGTLTINKAHLTVTADPKSMTYGASSLPGLTDTITGFMNGENSGVVSGLASLSTTATAYNGTAGTGSNAGTYTITAAANNLAAANYDFAYANGTLTVNKAVLTATADDQSRLYGAANPTFTETVTGYANGDTSGVLTGSATGNSAATTTTGVGAYTITGSTGTLGASNNYTFASANGALTINKVHLAVTADPKSMTYGSAEPVLTYTYSGLVGGDSSASFTGALARASGTNSGTYSILQSTLDATGNYSIGSYIPGVFTISGIPSTAIPDTVVRVSQNASLNVTTNPGFLTNSPTPLWGSQPDRSTSAPAPSENSRDPNAHNGDAMTTLSPSASGDPSDFWKNDTGHAYRSPFQPVNTQRGLMMIDPELAKRLALDMPRLFQF